MYELSHDDSRFIKNHYGGKLPVALNENDKWIKPDNGIHGWCPECGGKVISKISAKYDLKGRPQRRNHFAHYPSNPECSIHNREEGLWHLRQKAVFPIDWCEKTVIKTSQLEKRNRHRFVDVYSNEAKYTLEFESNIAGRDIKERDQFYTECNVRTSWIFKSSISSAKNDLEIIPLTDDTLHHLKAKQRPRRFYQSYIDKPFFRGVLLRGDIPISEHTTLAGMTFLNFSESLYLAVCPDKNERFKIDTTQEYVLGNLMSPANFLRVFRPHFRTEAQQGDESAIRMEQWAMNAAKKLIDAGGEYKLVGAGKKSAHFFENRKIQKKDLAEDILSVINKITGQDIVDLYEAGEIDKIVDCVYDADDMGNDLMRKLRYEAKQMEIERQELAQYKRGSITPSIIDLEEFSNIDPIDHSTFSEWEEESTLEPQKLDQVLDVIEKELEKSRIQKQTEEKRRKHLEEINKLITKGRHFLWNIEDGSISTFQQITRLENSLKDVVDIYQAYETWKKQLQYIIDENIRLRLEKKEYEEKVRQAQIIRFRKRAEEYLQNNPFFKNTIDKYLLLYDEISLLPGTPNDLAKKWFDQCEIDQAKAKQELERKMIEKELEKERIDKERIKALKRVELEKQIEKKRVEQKQIKTIEKAELLEDIEKHMQVAKDYLQTLHLPNDQKELYIAELDSMMKDSTYATSTYWQWRNTVVPKKLDGYSC